VCRFRWTCPTWHIIYRLYGIISVFRSVKNSPRVIPTYRHYYTCHVISHTPGARLAWWLVGGGGVEGRIVEKGLRTPPLPSWIRPRAFFFRSGGMRHVRHASGARSYMTMTGGSIYRAAWGKKFEMHHCRRPPPLTHSHVPSPSSGCHEYCIFNSGRQPPVRVYILYTTPHARSL